MEHTPDPQLPVYEGYLFNYDGKLQLFIHVFEAFFHQKLNGTESQRTPKSGDKAIRYSGSFWVRETWVLLEISWIFANPGCL